MSRAPLKMVKRSLPLLRYQLMLLLRMVWGSSFEPYVTPEWAGRQAETIHTPALSILGLSTQGEFYASL
jgi:hypothetical protein